MEPNTKAAEKRITSYTARCKAAAGQLFDLLEKIEALCADPHADESDVRALARQRHCWAIKAGAVEPIVPGVTHRAHLIDPHPQALPEGAMLRQDPGQIVTE